MDGPDGQEQNSIIARFQRESDAQDMERMLTSRFGERWSFFYCKEDDEIPINPGYVTLCDAIENWEKHEEIVKKENEEAYNKFMDWGLKQIKEGNLFTKDSKIKSVAHLEVFDGKIMEKFAHAD